VKPRYSKIILNAWDFSLVTQEVNLYQLWWITRHELQLTIIALVASE